MERIQRIQTGLRRGQKEEGPDGVRAFLVEPGVDLNEGEISFLFYSRPGVGPGDVEDDAAVDFAGVHAREDVVDVLDLLGSDVSVDHTFSGEVECLGEI